MDDGLAAPLVQKEQRERKGHELKAPPRERWLVLFLFSSVALSQALSWNFFGPISGPVKEVYGWSDRTIAWLANTANIAMLVSIPFSASLANRTSLRNTTIMCALLMFVCTLLRILPSFFSRVSHSQAFLWLQYMSMVCNGFAAAFLNFGGLLLSSQFFPAAERATATGIASVMCYAGVAFGFVLGPLCVQNSSHQKQHDIDILFLAEFIYTATVMLLVVVLFPSAPSTAASTSSAMLQSSSVTDHSIGNRNADHSNGRDNSNSNTIAKEPTLAPIETKVSTRKMLRLGVVAVAASLPLGVYSGWGSVLSINLSSFGVDQTEAGWLGGRFCCIDVS